MIEKMVITKCIERLYYIIEIIFCFFAYFPYKTNHLRGGRIKS